MIDITAVLLTLAAVPVAVLAIAMFLFFSLYSIAFRAAFIALGTLFLFQTEAVPSALKSAFVVLAVVFGLISLKAVLATYHLQTQVMRRVIRGILVAAVLCLGVALLGVVSSAWTLAPMELLIRDAINYALLPAVLVVGLDAGLSISFRAIAYTSIVVGLIGSVSTMVAWLQRREGEGSSFSQFGLASSFPVFVGVGVCLAMYYGSKRGRISWLILALVQMGIVVLAGGRQSIVVFAAALVIGTLMAQGSGGSRLSKITLTVAAAGLSLVLVVEYSNSFAGGIAVDRFQFFSRLLSGGLDVVESDGSAVHRSRAYAWMFEVWQQHPLIGQGLGQSLRAVRTGEVTYGLLTLDTPLVVLAKFGIIGTALLVGALTVVYRSIARFWGKGSGVLRTFLVLSLLFVVTSLPNGFPVENRGFAVFALALVAVGVALGADTQRRYGINGGHLEGSSRFVGE